LLTYNDKTEAFIVAPRDEQTRKLAIQAGLTLSTTAGCYFTTDPYAALAFYTQGDARAHDKLAWHWREYRSSWESDYDGQPLPAPPDLEYRPFQSAGIVYASNRQNTLIGDEPGLGKTIQAIGLANLIKAKHVLVICPASVRLQWRKEIIKWSLLAPRVRVYPILRSADGFNPHANYTIVSYDLARAEVIQRLLAERHWDIVVIDEAHYLKSPGAMRTRAIFGGGEGAFADRFIVKNAEHTLALTGTPLPNRPRECYTILRALAWDAIDWISQDKFVYRYNPSETDWDTGKTIYAVGRLPELRARLRCNVMIRRHKKDVLDQLPETQYELRYVEETGEVRTALKAEKMRGIQPGDSMFSLDGDAISTVRRMMGEAMAPQAAEYVAEVLDGGVEKVVVFAWHKSVVAKLRERLDPFGCVVIDGSTSAVGKYRAIQTFRTDVKCRVVVANIMAAGTGTDGLQDVCSHAIFAEPDWVPGNNQQCVDRLHRIGQRDSVLAQFLVAPGSFAEKILADSIEKLHDINEALDGGR
jgi:SWI/SNF-related matrix-associated actin-dependent regulator 1 of chromatin subfamily A